MVLIFRILLQFIYPLCLLLIGILLAREQEKQPKITGLIIILLSLIDIVYRVIQTIKSYNVV